MTTPPTTEQLRAAVHDRQGITCLAPHCRAPWEQMAHLEPSGMGGRDNRRPDNLVGLCHNHHDVFDGRTLHGRQRLLVDLMQDRADTLARARLLLAKNIGRIED